MRKLASIQTIAEIQPIEGADAIVKVRVQDWWCVAKVGEFSVGDLAVYFEIDSLLPQTPVFEFLRSRGVKQTELEDGTIVSGFRLRTVRLRGQVSQGLALPISMFDLGDVVEGQEVTQQLGVNKYEPPMDKSLAGNAIGLFPAWIRKTDQERCQNLRRSIFDAYVAGDQFEVTAKLDGSSCTVYRLTDDQFEKFGKVKQSVCSRNIDLEESEGNAFWDVIRKAEAGGATPFIPGYAVQGELISPSIQKNFECVDRPGFNVFSVFDIAAQEYLKPADARDMCDRVGLKTVPVLFYATTLRELLGEVTQDEIIPALLKFAEGPGSFGGPFREGVVFKRVDGKFSFKAISNQYLLKEKD